MAAPPKLPSAPSTSDLNKVLAAQTQLGAQGPSLVQHSELLQALLADSQKSGQTITGGPLELGTRLLADAIEKRGLDAANRNIFNAASNQQHAQAAGDLQALGQTPDPYTPLPTNLSAWGGGGPPTAAADHDHAVDTGSGSVPLMLAPNSVGNASGQRAAPIASPAGGSSDYSDVANALAASGLPGATASTAGASSPGASDSAYAAAIAAHGGNAAAPAAGPTVSDLQMASALGDQASGSANPAAPALQLTAPADPLGAAGPAVATADQAPPTLGGSYDPAAKTYAFFRNAGLSHGAASGVVGSLQAESGLNPIAWNPKEHAFGIGQWRDDRLAALQGFARSRGTQPGDLDTQLAFMQTEMGGPERQAAAFLQGANDPQSGAAAMNHYLRPAGFHLGGDPRSVSRWSTRAGNSERAASMFGGQGGDRLLSAPASQQMQAPQQGGGAFPQAYASPQAASYPQAAGGGAPAMPPGGPMSPGGGQPPLPSDPLGSGQPAPMQAPGPTGPRANPVGPTAQQISLLRQMQNSPDPSVRAQAHEYGMQLRMQSAPPPAWEPHVDQTTGRTLYVDKNNPSAAPMQTAAPQGYVAPAPAKMVYNDRLGRYVPQAGTEQSAPLKLSPSAFGTQDAFGNWTVSNVPNRAGEAPAGKQFNPATGGYDFIPGAQPQTTGKFQDGSVVTWGADGKPTVSQAPAYAASDFMSQREKFLNSDDYKQHVNTANALNSLQRALSSATSNNGLLDMAAIDNLVRAQTGLSARQGNVQLLLSHLGVPQEVMGQVSNALGTGPVTPESLRNAISVLRAYTDTHQATAQHRLDEENAIAQRYGYKDLGITLPRVDPMPDVPWMRALPPPQQQAGGPPASANPMHAGGGVRPAAAPPPGQRRAGQVYNTPRGPMRFTGSGWVNP